MAVAPGETLCEIGDVDCPLFIIVRGRMGSGSSKRRSIAVHPDDSISRTNQQGNAHNPESARVGILRPSRVSPMSDEGTLAQRDSVASEVGTESEPRRRVAQRIQFEDSRSTSTSGSEGSNSVLTARGDRLTEPQMRKVRHCLQNFEGGLDIEFDADEIISSIQIVTVSARENVFVYGVESIGMYIVDSGALNVCTDKGETVVGHLLAGDFCGELSTLFDIKSTAQVLTECDSVLLFLPKDKLMGCLSGELSMDKLLDWCVLNCYVDLSGLFDTGHLTQELAMWALKSCQPFSDLELSLTSTIAQQARLMAVAPGETLCEIGDVDCPLFIIIRGSFELSRSNEATGHKTVRKCTNSYPVNIKSFMDMVESVHTLKSVGPCLVMVVDRTLLHRSLLI